MRKSVPCSLTLFAREFGLKRATGTFLTASPFSGFEPLKRSTQETGGEGGIRTLDTLRYT